METVPHTYTGWDRKDVQVLVDSQWYDGELRSWDMGPDGWSAIVTWQAGVGDRRIGRFPADRIRPA